jgi:hypothetical protein
MRSTATRGCLDGQVAPVGSTTPPAMIASPTCGVDDLCLAYDELRQPRRTLVLDDEWPKRWTATWRFSGSPVVCPVRDLASMPTTGSEPVRRFSWCTGQRHRPGLQYLVSTDRHHGFESIAEQRLLVALDFAGWVLDVLAQPFRLRFATREGWLEHIPDFLAVTRGGGLLVDVRPGDRIGEDDRVRFAAAAETALVGGWRYIVVTGWRPHVLSTLDTLSAQRRRLSDPAGIQAEVLAAARSSVTTFGALVAGTALPPLARAHALHLTGKQHPSPGARHPPLARVVPWQGLGGAYEARTCGGRPPANASQTTHGETLIIPTATWPSCAPARPRGSPPPGTGQPTTAPPS